MKNECGRIHFSESVIIKLLMKIKKKRRKIKLGDNQKEIIKCVGVGLFVIASIALPTLPMALQPILKMRGKEKFQRLLKELEKKRFIEFHGEKIKLTAKGRKMLDEIQVSELNIQEPKEWDGFWHLVSYDIPEKYKKSRDFFRRILENNGFLRIQESLWVHPFPCEEEIAITIKKIDLFPYVITMKTEKLPNEKKIQRLFQLDDSDNEDD